MAELKPVVAYISDVDAATRGLVSMGARAKLLNAHLANLIASISALEESRPWGDTKEYGQKFEKEYFSTGNTTGSAFIKDNISILSDEVNQGTQLAYEVVKGTVSFDDDFSGAFKITDASGNYNDDGSPMGKSDAAGGTLKVIQDTEAKKYKN
jgi:hypothetical protein